MDYKISIGEKRIRGLQKNLGSKSWPEFMQHDRIVRDNWPNLYSDFLNFQFALLDNKKLIGIGNSVPLLWQNSFEDLPAAGMDWAMIKAKEDIQKGLEPNLLIGIQILLHREYQAHGISYEMLKLMKEIAKSNGIKNIALPVRPTLKCQYPLIPMEDYIHWKNKEGLAFDPWIRVHSKTGGRILRICEKSMDISGSLSEWEKWTGMNFPGSGNYVVHKALVPIQVDKENNIGKYIEPNVWIVHDAE